MTALPGPSQLVLGPLLEPEPNEAAADHARPLDVRFDGLASPIRCAGKVGERAIELSATLGFLRVGSRVAVEPAAGEAGPPRVGKIENVCLRVEGGVPRFEIALALDDRPKESAPLAPLGTEREWSFPEIIVEMQAEEEPAGSAPTPLVAPEDRTERMGTPSRVRRVVLLSAFAVVAGAATAGFVMRHRWLPSPAEAPAVQAMPAAPPLIVAPPVMVGAPLAVEAPRVVPEHPVVEEEEPPPPPPAPAAAPWHPEVQVAGGHARIAVPVTGSTAGMSTFRLTDPPGIAIDLPKATAAVPLKAYPLHKGAFQSLWVRENPKGGLQIRAHLAPRTPATVTVADGEVRIAVPAGP